jgi:hypothetical protein
VYRIIDGVKYDTETATEVVGGDNFEWSNAWWGLFQTRHGAFFEVLCDHDGETHKFTPLTDDEARARLEKHGNHLVAEYFGPVPEHGSAEKRLTVRLPISLACRVEAAAAKQQIHVNGFIMRALERAVNADGQIRGRL